MYLLSQSYNQTSRFKRCIYSNAYRLPYYQEKDSGKNIRELLPDVWKLKKSNENPIEV